MIFTVDIYVILCRWLEPSAFLAPHTVLASCAVVKGLTFAQAVVKIRSRLRLPATLALQDAESRTGLSQKDTLTTFRTCNACRAVHNKSPVVAFLCHRALRSTSVFGFRTSQAVDENIRLHAPIHVSPPGRTMRNFKIGDGGRLNKEA